MTVRQARPRPRYSDVHPDSPIARGYDIAGPVNVPADRADIAHSVSVSELRRAYSLGVCSATRGLAPDSHQMETGLAPQIDNASDYLAWWIGQALSWADQPDDIGAVNPDESDAWHAARLAQIDQWAAELVTVAPVWFVDWAGRLIHPPKWQHLIELGAAQWLGAPAPHTPGDQWADRMGRQWAARLRSGEHVAAVVRDLEQF